MYSRTAAKGNIEIDQCLNTGVIVLDISDLSREEVFLSFEHFHVGVSTIVHQLASAFVCLLQRGNHDSNVLLALPCLAVDAQVPIHLIARIEQGLLKL